jgi:hypothetical protein
MPLWDELEHGTKRAVAIWHRRAGKDLVSLNWTIVQAFERPGLYWHVLPTYRQGRKIVWDGLTGKGRSFLSHWPDELIVRKRDDEMSVWLANGAIWQIIGADDVDRLVGANPVGVVFSEYSLCEPRIWDFLRPILAENGGWALFIYTPRGRNHAYKLRKMAEEHKSWFFQILTVDDTKAIDEEAIEDERTAGMPEELIQQEFYCSFDAPLVGSYFGDQITTAAKENRITKVPWEPTKPVSTAWDLGIGDATSIWFFQQVAMEIRFIDYYEHHGVGLEHYSKILQEKPYTYNEHLVPHDAQVRELGTGKSRLEVARSLGLRMRVVPKLSLDDGIQAVRAILPRSWFDEERTEDGVQALREYRKEWDSLTETFRNKPRHDWTSHAADGIRTAAVGIRPERKKVEKLYPDLAIV